MIVVGTHTHTPHTWHTPTLRDPRRSPWRQSERQPGRKCQLPWNKRGKGQRSVLPVRTIYNSDVPQHFGSGPYVQSIAR